jgi:fluoride exporter
VTAAPAPRLVAAVAVGGALGALARWAITVAFPTANHEFPWTIFGINVAGSLVLALLPAVAAVRRNRELAVALGPGVLGGFTTLSTYSEQTRALVDAGEAGTALFYAVGTLAACLAAVSVASRFRAEGRDE